MAYIGPHLCRLKLLSPAVQSCTHPEGDLQTATQVSPQTEYMEVKGEGEEEEEDEGDMREKGGRASHTETKCTLECFLLLFCPILEC
ncbi:hypothetical protein NQZ68_022587 [Dissostichus eleginoides]|nr:hypothetical protein NQZ68_022587 [Dissostichus eleginoides]